MFPKSGSTSGGSLAESSTARDVDELSVSAAAREAPERIALVFRNRAVTFAELASRTAARADELRAQWAETECPVVFVARPELHELIETFAALEARVPFVPLHPRLSEPEREALRARLRTGSVPGHIAAVLFTSGTSGEPKGVLLSRSAFVASAAASEANLGWRDDDRWLLAMPFAHAGGLSILTRCLAARRTVVVEPAFDAAATLRSIVRNRVTLLSVVPTMLAALLDVDVANVDETDPFVALRAVLVGGAHCPSALLRRARARGMPALLTYGTTETCSQIATQRLGDVPLGADPDADAMSARVLPGIDVRIASSADERTGPIEVHGPVVMDGYLGQAPMAPGSWYRTGDVGSLEDGPCLHVLGRADDTIITGGENVHPAEVEPLLRSHARIRDAVVFGVPDEKWGEIVAAALVLEPDVSDVSDAAHADIAAMLTQACETLAAFKRPRQFVVVDELPVNSAGKVDRRAVRALASLQAKELV